MPELTEISKHIMFEETSQGLNLEIVDQDGRSMFADGSKAPYDRTRRLIQKLAGPLKATPLRDCPSSATPRPASCRREATMARSIFRPTAPTRCARSWSGKALPPSHIFAVSGKADSQPLFPDDPYAVGQPSRDHHIDARRSAAAARSEAVDPRNYYLTSRTLR